jgi:putative redox protein
MTMKAHLVHEGEMLFRTKIEETQEILFDAGDPETRKGPSPMQGVLAAAMACTAADVVSILRKKRVPFTSLEIDADAERAEEHPRVFTNIAMQFRLRGTGIREADVQRAIELSSEKYCSVEAMLRNGSVGFVNTHEILPRE